MAKVPQDATEESDPEFYPVMQIGNRFMFIDDNERHELDYGREQDELDLEFEMNGQIRWSRWLETLRKGPEAIRCLKLLNYGDIYDLQDETILRTATDKFLDLHGRTNPLRMQTARRFFPDEALWKKWATAYFIENNQEVAAQLWRENLLSHVDGSPGGFLQIPSRFGALRTLSPSLWAELSTPVPAREFYGPQYVPTYAGIGHETVWLLKKAFAVFPKDLFHLLMRYIWKAETENILQSLRGTRQSKGKTI